MLKDTQLESTLRCSCNSLLLVSSLEFFLYEIELNAAKC